MLLNKYDEHYFEGGFCYGKYDSYGKMTYFDGKIVCGYVA